MRVELLHPGASWSTADVFDGLLYGLRYHGAEVITYRLDTRIEASSAAAHYLWRVRKRTDPTAQKSSIADIWYDAGCRALETALRHRVDVVIIVSAMFIIRDLIEMMKRAGLRVVILFTESPYDQEEELRLAPLVDGCWTNERASLPAFMAVNPNAGYLPHAWHPDKHYVSNRSIGDLPSHDVVFVGSGFPERVEWFNAINWTDIDLGLYGSWKNLGLKKQVSRCVRGGTISNEMAASLYRRAKIGLNLYRARGQARRPLSVVPESLSPRAYELAQCGAFHLSEYRREVQEVFGHRVPTFSTPIEAAALIRLWLKQADERQRLAAELPACVAEASWITRAATVLGDLQRLMNHQAAVPAAVGA